MKEIEVLVKVNSSKEEVIKALEKFEFLGVKETIDIYYYDPLRDNLKPNKKLEIDECLRLRSKDGENSITYKVDNFSDDGTWLYSDEYETKIDDIFMLNKIFDHLGLKELLSIHNSKRTYKYKDYEIVFETVKELGYFLEVEYCTNEDVDVLKIKNEIKNFINTLGLDVTDEATMGKPEMIIKKNNIIV